MLLMNWFWLSNIALVISHNHGITGFYEIFSVQFVYFVTNLLYNSWCMISDFEITVDICTLQSRKQNATMGWILHQFGISNISQKRIIGFCEIFSVQFVHLVLFSVHLCFQLSCQSIDSFPLIQNVLQSSVKQPTWPGQRRGRGGNLGMERTSTRS